MSNKYISSEPWWAGYANVRMSLEIALSISEVTNRKFIIPPGIYFNAINPWDKKETYVDIFDIWDEVVFMSTFNCVKYYDVPEYRSLDKGLTYFYGIENVAKILTFTDEYKELHPLPSCIGFTLYNEIKNLDDFKEFSQERKPYSLNYKDKFIHFPRNLFGHFYHSVYCSSDKQSKELRKKMLKGIKFKKKYNKAVVPVLKKLKGFNSLHIRRGDFINTRPETVGLLSQIPLFLEKNLFIKDLPLYIATDEKDKSIFDFLKEKYKIYFLNDFFANLSGLDATILDQVICSNSLQFLGSKLSTFSDYIHVNRASMGNLTNPRVGNNFSRKNLQYKKYPWVEEDWGWDKLYSYYWDV